MNHAHKKVGACLKDASTKTEIELHNSKVKVRNACPTAMIGNLMTCLKLHARHGYKRVSFDFHPSEMLLQFCRQEGIETIIGVDTWVCRWA